MAAIGTPRQEMVELSEGILAACRRLSVLMTYQRGETLVRQGESPVVVRFIEDGLCKLVWRSADGRQALMGFRMRGWLIGATRARWNDPQGFAIEALTRCSVRQIAIESFKTCVYKNPSLMQALLRVHALELEQAHSIHLLALASLPSRTRVEMLLSWLHAAGVAVRHEGDESSVTDMLSQRDMADVLAMAPETLTRIMKRLEHDGLVVRRHGWITLRAIPAVSVPD